MKKLALLLCLLTASAVAQISGAGSLGCNPYATTGTVWNSSTALNSTQTFFSAQAATYVLIVYETSSGTYSAGQVTIEVTYDGTNYVSPVGGMVNLLTNSGVTNPVVTTSNLTYLISVPIYGVQSGRMRLSTAIVGTVTLSPQFITTCSQQPLSFDENNNLNVTISSLPMTTWVENWGSFTGPGVADATAFGTTAPSGNAPGVNSALFEGVTPVSASAPLSVVEPKPSTIVAGHQAVTATAAALSTQAVNNKVCVEALSTNAISVFLGPSGVTTSTGFELVPKAVQCYEVSNVNAVYVIASTTGASVTWSGN